jgi:ABC-2 type transport system ATP-binding protein
MNPVLRLTNVSKKYRRQVALDDVSLEVPPGIVCALLGENGAGKTTAIRILLGLVQQDAGQAEVLGRDSQKEGQEIRRLVGYVSERPALYDWMTIAEIGWFAAGFFGGRYLERYRELAAGFGLDLEKKIKELSKGTRAKVSLSLAMAHDPALLLLDEPTSGLDPLVRRQFLESMVELAAAGQTVLLSSHQIAEVERVANRIAILRHGKLVLVEDIEDLKRTASELTVTLKNGTPTLPVIPGTVVKESKENRQHRLLIRHVDESKLAALRSHETVQAVEQKTPSLEEIFVAYMTN